jgi:cyclic pyranopterin monophosphate synthase
MAEFTHYSGDGSPTMVDVSGKSVTSRKARASGFVRLRAETLDLISSRLLPKGNLFEIAKIAGISAAKKTSELIPLCHPLMLNFVDVALFIEDSLPGIRIESEVRVEGRTGAEMEALTAVTAAALTVYDMCKAVDKTMVIENIRLIEKRGGKSDFSI